MGKGSSGQVGGRIGLSTNGGRRDRTGGGDVDGRRNRRGCATAAHRTWRWLHISAPAVPRLSTVSPHPWTTGADGGDGTSVTPVTSGSNGRNAGCGRDVGTVPVTHGCGRRRTIHSVVPTLCTRRCLRPGPVLLVRMGWVPTGLGGLPGCTGQHDGTARSGQRRRASAVSTASSGQCGQHSVVRTGRTAGSGWSAR